jgi:hypothetical protein
MIAPVDLTRPAYETTLVGMKPSSSYVYRVEVTADALSCASDDHTIMTGELANPTPAPAVTVMDPERHYQRGFTLAVSNDAERGYAFIYDADGTVVWAAPPGSVPDWPSRAHLSWDATRFIVMALNWGNTDIGVITSMAMDGSDVKSIEGATSAHHDFVAIPGGIAAFLWSADGADAPSSLVEFLDAGGSRTVVSDIATLYTGEAPSSFHANSVHYHPSDETYTLGDRRWSQYLKVTRDGELVWQLGGMEPLDPAKVFSGVDPWLVGHGHHLTSDGTFAFFDNNFERGQMTPATVHVYHLDEPTLTATRLAMFAAQGSSILGDVQRLPSGNFLVTNSDSGFVQEMTSEGGVVAVIYPASSGYSEFRESLYGPPPY